MRGRPVREGCLEAGAGAPEPRPAVGSEDGAGLLWFHAFLLWFGLVLAIAVIDVGAYLVAAARAQTAADHAALAAVSADATLRVGRDVPVAEARSVATRARARLDGCACRPGRGRAEVTVSVEVPGLVVPRVMGMQRVTATAAAALAPPDPDAPRTGIPRPPAPPPSSTAPSDRR